MTVHPTISRRLALVMHTKNEVAERFAGFKQHKLRAKNEVAEWFAEFKQHAMRANHKMSGRLAEFKQHNLRANNKVAERLAEFKQHIIPYGLLLLSLVLAAGCDSSPPDNTTQSSHAAFWSDAYHTTAERFEAAKQSGSALTLFLQKMPKGADLHNHLLGATYSEYLLDTARKNKLNYDKEQHLFTPLPHENNDAIITIDELIENDQVRQAYFDLFSMRGWRPQQSNGHDHFFQTFARIASSGRVKTPELLAETLSEVAARNREQNIRYLELMVSIDHRLIADQVDARLGDFELDRLDLAYQKLQALFDDQELKRTINSYFDRLEQRIDSSLSSEHGYRLLGDNPDIVLRYMAQLLRHDPERTFFVHLFAGMLAIHHDRRVLSLNIVQPEGDPRALKNFDGQMKMIDYLWDKVGQPPISLHAGELVLSDSPLEPMRDRIKRSIYEGHAKRIGHGLSIGWERDAIETLAVMRQQGILVEICLSSNEYISSIKGWEHPFLLYRSAGVPVSLNTDDEGVNRGNLTVEFIKAVQRYDLSYEDVVALARNSLEYSFMPGSSLYIDGDYQRLQPEYDDVREENYQGGMPTVEDNLKLRMQIQFERDLVAFEKAIASK